MNAMNRKFTLREIILMLVLVAVVFVALYVMLVYYPVSNRTAEIEEQMEQVQAQSQSADINIALYNRMKRDLEEINKIPEDKRTKMNKHTDEEGNAIHAMLSEIFAGIKSQTNTTQTRQGNVWRRAISFSFTISNDANAYDRFKEIITALTTTGRRSLLDNLQISPTGGDVATATAMTVSGVITFYELA